MAEEAPSKEPIDEPIELQLLNERFELYSFVSNTLIKELKRPRDVIIIRKMLETTKEYYSHEDLDVKKNVLVFFKYLLRILRWTCENQPISVYRKWFENKCTRNLPDMTEDQSTSTAWTEENKSYFASKTLPTGMVIFYVAMSEDPAAGWQRRGLEVLRKKELDEQLMQLSDFNATF